MYKIVIPNDFWFAKRKIMKFFQKKSYDYLKIIKKISLSFFETADSLIVEWKLNEI